MKVVDRSRQSRSRKRRGSSHDLDLRETGEVREVDDSVPVSFADKPSGAAKAQKGSLRSVVQLQWWMSCASGIRNHIAPNRHMKVLGVILIGLLLSIWGWSYIATLLLYVRAYSGNVVWDLGVSLTGWSLPFSDGCLNRDCTADKISNTSWPMPVANEGMKNDPILEPKHKIFLSHSGVQKEFVEHLCKALEDRFYYPFFDRRLESLPKGEQFPELIVQAAEQCELFIVVVSEEYFMSKWPMIELSAFVKAHKLHHESKDSTKGPKILPLFYGLSVDDLKDATMQKKWSREWETLAKADLRKRIKVGDWKYALDVLKSFNGLSYDKNLKEIVSYEEKIVSYVSKSILPDIRWDDSHVQGKPNMLKVIGEKIEGMGVSKKYKVKVVGIYGVGGIGKTTMCKTLCNELSNKYEGRVCHIEFPNAPWSDSKEFYQKILRDLTRKSMEVIQQLNEGECMNVLHKSLINQRIFLAIDNVLGSDKSIQLAKALLELPYHRDSLVVVTSRSESVLKFLRINEDAYLEIPNLEEADAVKLFLHHAASGQQFFDDEEKQDILTCVRRCYFFKGDGQGQHYHPLALQVLGSQLNYYGENPSIWMKKLPRVNTFKSLLGGNPLFDILRSSFDLLSPRDQTFFMDVGYFSYMTPYSGSLYSDWVFDIYNQDEEEFSNQIERLNHKGLLMDVDLMTKRFSIHDLYREFSLLEAKGSLTELELGERKWLSIEDGDFSELISEREHGYWHKLIRLGIKYQCESPLQDSGIEGLEDIKWGYFLNLEVLQLCNLNLRHGALKFEDLGRLKILEVIDGHIDGIEGLEKLKHLTSFTWVVNPYMNKNYPMQFSNLEIDVHIVGQLPPSLKRLTIYGNVVLVSDLLIRCYHLSNLELHWVVAHSLDLSTCWSLERVSFWGIRKLQTLSGLATSQPSNLKSLDISYCLDLVDTSGIDHLTSLEELLIKDCPKFEVPSLNGFNQLEVLTLRGIDGLTSLEELGDLPALRHLDLGNCKHLMRLPNLSKSRNLQKLNLEGCSTLILHEKDIQMLSALPLLKPLTIYQFYGMYFTLRYKLDLHRGKLLLYRGRWTMEDEWQERNLGLPPIEIKKLLDPFFLAKEYVNFSLLFEDVQISHSKDGWVFGSKLHFDNRCYHNRKGS